jgi:hypothetical protein
MATGATVQVQGSSIDAEGLSVSTTLASGVNPQQGTIYNPATLAAAAPVWFHKLATGSYLALFRSVWSAATVGLGGPQSYSAATESSAPAWTIIEPTTGAAGPPTALTSLLTGVRVLNGATTYRDFFYTVGTLDGVPHLVHYRISRDGTLVLQGEELLPVTEGVSFSLGCAIDGNWLIVYGSDSTGKLYERRKSWARVGINNGVDNWLYGGAKGYLADPITLTPLLSGGVPIITNGPVSAARSREMYFLSTVLKTTGTNRPRVGHIYKQRALDSQWTDDGAAVALGDATTWLGGGLYFQPQLQLADGGIPAGSLGALPYLSSMRTSAHTGEKSILTSWGLWPITR